ncbi:TRAP transporter small permease subunit [Pannonibacter tanglangensis]|uniref:TRAP transporter small permease protein n=1 Tax=Pannonibacter tanglangensis TaxID=2750084 RepID=A0ABW9ZK92_9HYPH|nr:TRAP transporter small permease subunit [Pannonibacter sp. XCT-34]NBN65333.1 TRAP transporter small permease subunit [Pannonibacter sp. XCT-34]
MLRVARALSGLNHAVGHAVSWLMLAIVLVQFGVVILRYVFGTGSIWVQEGIIYMFGFLFLLSAGYSLALDGHVRVDIFYRDAAARTKALVDCAGSILFLLPMCAVILWQSWPFVMMSWMIREGSRETSGLPALYLLKAAILLYAGLLALQGVALMLRAIAALRGDREALATFPTHQS